MAHHAAMRTATLNGLLVRIIILTKNLTIYRYTYNYSHSVCNWIPTSIIWSLTLPVSGICAITPFWFIQSPVTFRKQIFNYTSFFQKLCKMHTTYNSPQLATQCHTHGRINVLYPVPVSVGVQTQFARPSVGTLRASPVKLQMAQWPLEL
jgi:hypothetical protein